MAGTSILWRRLDVPGHDACRLEGGAGGWRIEGTAIFREAGATARLMYQVTCDPAWQTQHGSVSGWIGDRSVKLHAAHSAAGWTLNGVSVTGLDDCVDLDLGFSPATNLLTVRRLALAIGQAADVPVAWLDVDAGTLSRLPQRYQRRDADTYFYESPTVAYAGLLVVTPAGFVATYPGLWEQEA